MPLTIFLACCILGMDCMVFLLFQWVLSEKSGARARKLAARKGAGDFRSTRPWPLSVNSLQLHHATEREAA